MHASRGLSRLVLGLAVLAFLGSESAGRAAEYPWKAGLARQVITPQEPMWMAGYASRKAPSDGKVHDLYAKAIALQDAEGARLVIVTLDLIGITNELGDYVLKQAAEKYQLHPRELLLNASHTHCGPELRAERVALWGLPAEQTAPIERNFARLRDQLVNVVGQSLADLKPARLTISQDAADFARNRRFPTENGFVNRQYDDGPVDHEVPVLQVWRGNASTGEDLAAVLFGYACHNTTLGIQQFCGDYAGFAQAELEKRLPGTQAMFVMGAGGDQNPYPRGKLELAETHGRTLAAAVARALDKPGKAVASSLRTARAAASLQFDPLPSRQELTADLESTNMYRARKARYLLDRLDGPQAIDMTYPCPVQVARLGEEVLLVAIGGEVVVDYSHKLKSAYSGGPTVWVAGYSNDVFGYLPSRRVRLEGGYEAGGAMLYGKLPGPFSDDVEQRVMSTIDQLIRDTNTNPKDRP